MSRIVSVSFGVAVLLFLAPAACATEIDLASDSPDWTVWGDQDNAAFGRLAQVADVNDDGHLDLIVGQHAWDHPTLGVSVGRVLIFFGPFRFPDELDLQVDAPDVVLEGAMEEQYFGAVVVTSDIDDDGVGDLLIGSWMGGISAPTLTSGSIAIFRGRRIWPAQMTWSDADWIFLGADEQDNIVWSDVADLNGDGASDLVILAPFADGLGNNKAAAGEVYVFFGPTSSWSKSVYDLSVDAPDVHILGADEGDGLGDRLHTGDIVNDAVVDLIVSAPSADGIGNLRDFAGEVHIFAGRSVWPARIDLSMETADLTIIGELDGWPRGANLRTSLVGDLDGDGTNDLIMAARFARSMSERINGAIYVLKGDLGPASTIDLETRPVDHWFLGPRPNSEIGYWMELGDVNGDGFADIVSGSFGEDTPYSRRAAGGILVMGGCSTPPPFQDLALQPPMLEIYGAASVDWIGGTVTLGDMNDDGRQDLIFGGYGIDGPMDMRPGAGAVHIILGRATTAVCSISADPGTVANVCEGTDLTLDGGATAVTTCGVPQEYRWMDGTTVVRGWSTDPNTVVRPTQTTVYRLDVRCGDCGGPCFDSAEVTITVEPDIIPPDLGNTVRAVRRGIVDVELTWDPVAEAKSYSLYRSTAKETWPPVFLEDLPMPENTLPDQPYPPKLYFYRAAGASCSGVEGP